MTWFPLDKYPKVELMDHMVVVVLFTKSWPTLCNPKNCKLGEGNGTPLQYSCLENPMDGGAWWAAVHGVAKSRTRLRDFPFTFHFPALEKEMATHSSVVAWRIPGMAESGGLPSMGSHRVGHDWGDLAAAAEGKQDQLRADHTPDWVYAQDPGV